MAVTSSTSSCSAPPAPARARRPSASWRASGCRTSRPATSCAPRSRRAPRWDSRRKRHMDAGELVPDEVVIGIVRDRLAEPDTANGLPARRLPAHDRAGRASRRACSPRRAAPSPTSCSSTCPRTSWSSASPDVAPAPGCGKLYNVTFDPPRARGRLRRLRRRALAARRRQRGDGAQPARRLPQPDRAARRLLHREGRARRGARRRQAPRRGLRASHRRSSAAPDAVIVRKSAAEIARIAAAGRVLADCLDAPRRGRPARRHHGRARPARRVVHPRARRRADLPRLPRLSGARSAPRPTTWSCTASPGATASPRATCSASTWASRSTATSPTRRSRCRSAPSAPRPCDSWT